MHFNAHNHLSGMERTVSFSERDGLHASIVALSRSYDTSVEHLWHSVTDPARIARWFAPVSGNLELGGRYQVQGNAGGLITACEQLAHFAITWEFGGDTSWVEARFSDNENGGASLSLAHTAHISEHWDTYGPGAVGVGWEMGFLGLALHIEQPDEPMPDDAQFAASPSGRSFIVGSSEGWMQAAISAGTDPAVAETAALRTTSFYTGEPMEAE